MIYENRPDVCILYPIDKNDIIELKKTTPDFKCSYFFVSDRNAPPENSEPIVVPQGNSLLKSLNAAVELLQLKKNTRKTKSYISTD